MNDDPETHSGSCLCGAVRFEVVGPLPSPDACHCTDCRKVGQRQLKFPVQRQLKIPGWVQGDVL
jgi:hypothetical protein